MVVSAATATRGQRSATLQRDSSQEGEAGGIDIDRIITDTKWSFGGFRTIRAACTADGAASGALGLQALLAEL